MSEQPKQVVVVDTNALWSDQPFRDSVRWKKLLSYAVKYPAVDFIVPDVVVHERARQESDYIARSRSEGIKALAKAQAAFARAGIRFSSSPTVEDARALVPESRQRIYEQMRSDLSTARILVAPIPTIAHDTLVSWSLDAHPPFDTTDKGYRDALIWCTVRNIAVSQRHGATTLFVGADRDYTEEPPKKDNTANGTEVRVLNSKLATDLSQVTSNTVTVVRSLEDAAAVLVQPNHAEADRGVRQLDETTSIDKPDEFQYFDERPSRDELLREKIEAACDRLVGEDIGSSYEGPAPKFDYEIPDVENATVTAVTPDLSTILIDVHERFESETVIGDVSVEVEVLYEGYATKANACAGNRKWTVTDGDWNEHYALVEGELQAELKYQFVLNNEDVTLEFDNAHLDD